jgi:dsDNA-specific endonuclease/ATPase MutS2
MAFKVGDRVHIIDEDSEGIITQLNSGNIAFVEIDGFEYEFEISQLLKVNADKSLTHKATEKSFEHLLENKVYKRSQEVIMHRPVKLFDKVSRFGYPELDLHIHELVHKPKDLTNSEMIEIQIHRLENFIQSCTTKSVTEFVIIHGVGQGVLRTEIRKVLQSHGNIKYNDANFREYGAGATHAKILGLFTG